MEKFLYDDLNELESSHWWHLAKRETVVKSIKGIKSTKSIKGFKILDIGCGTGQNLIAFGGLGEAYGIDNSPEAIKYCRLKGLSKVKLGSSYRTGFAKNSFDVVTLLDVLEHVEENETLKEISRILKKD